MKIIRPVNITSAGSITRASTATYFDKDGVEQVAPVNVPRINYDPVTHEMTGVLIEPEKTNFAKLSEVWSDSAVTVYEIDGFVAGTYMLSFYGTGTVTISGPATGSIVGTGSYPGTRNQLQFTKVSGDVTFTCTGTVTKVQIEQGTTVTSYIPLLAGEGNSKVRSEDVVTGTGILYSTFDENDHAEWDAATNYSVGTRVIRLTTHKIYQNFIAGVNATLPESDTSGRWVEVGPTNKFAPFDNALTSSCSTTNSITYILKPGRISGLAILGMNATHVEVALFAGGETVYSGSADLLTGTTIGSWYQYFYEPIYQNDSLVITELIDTALLNLPQYGDGILSITIQYEGNTVSVAEIVCGLVADVGITQHDTNIGIIDYSKIETNTFGNASVVKRAFSKRLNVPLIINNSQVDNVVRLLSLYRATPLVWVATDNIYNTMVAYGYYKDWEVNLTDVSYSRVSIQIEGLAQ